MNGTRMFKMLLHKTGNLIDLAEEGEFDIIVHGCNCQNTMGSGIAKEIKERYPKAFKADRDFDDFYLLDSDKPYSKLGNYTQSYCGKDPYYFYIINAYTQIDYLPRGVDHFEYSSFEVILKKLSRIYPGKKFGFPYIGMGLAGGDEKRILNLLDSFAKDVTTLGGTVTLVRYEGM